MEMLLFIGTRSQDLITNCQATFCSRCCSGSSCQAHPGAIH